MHLYLHIPFCKQACYYCDFHFSTQTSRKEELVKAICREIELQKDYLTEKSLQTVYFGGGTPSLLSEKEIGEIIRCIHQRFSLPSEAEITLEANPDDVNKLNLTFWKSLGINRLSIGIQSFHEAHLRYLNRAHTASEAEQCVKLAQDYSFENQTIDLIYGIPANDHSIWEKDLEKALNLGINHLSAYCLTIEDKTVFGNRLRKKQMKPIQEDFASEQFEILLRESHKAGFEQYEISNFAKNEAYSKHNTSYWLNEPYLGIGPSAHSFDRENRQWNIANNALYIKSLLDNEVPFEIEKLTDTDRANELIMTGLRTKWGVDLKALSKWADIKDKEFVQTLKDLQRAELIELRGEQLLLTQKAKLKADRIASDLFFV